MSTTNNTDKTPGEGTPPCPKAAKETLPVLKAKKKTPSSMDVNLSSGSVGRRDDPPSPVEQQKLCSTRLARFKDDDDDDLAFRLMGGGSASSSPKSPSSPASPSQ